jgi:hypothetical protein
VWSTSLRQLLIGPGVMGACFCGCGRRVGLRSWNADRYGKQAKWLLESVSDAAQAVSAGAVTRPEHTQFIEEAHRWEGIWAGVVHGEPTPEKVDRAAWHRWYGDSVEMLDRLHAQARGGR